jgi:hypothetical protein
MLELAGHPMPAPSVFVEKIVDFFSFGTLGGSRASVRHHPAGEHHRTGDGGGAIVRGRCIEELAAIGWSLVFPMLLGPVLLPWYVVGALPSCGCCLAPAPR